MASTVSKRNTWAVLRDGHMIQFLLKQADMPFALQRPSPRLPSSAAVVLGALLLGMNPGIAWSQAAGPADPSPTAPTASPLEPAPQRLPAANPPAPRELTPAEITALQSLMTDRATGAVLTPSNAEAIRNKVFDAQRSPLVSGYPASAPRARPRMLVIDPQVLLATPQELQLALGVVTPVTFLDERGRPWPVESVAFDPRMFAQDGAGCGAPGQGGAVVGAGERPSTINVMPCRLTTWGNISIKLENYPLPVVLMARSSGGNAAVDLPVTIRVRGRSPSAPIQPYEAAAAYVPAPVRTTIVHRAGYNSKGMETDRGRVMPDRMLDSFGAGVTPKNAERVSVDDPSVTAWMLDGHLYLRGPVTVINPAHDAEAESVGGMKVWRFDRPVPRVYVVDESGAERALTVQF